jgi:hypothetical protein
MAEQINPKIAYAILQSEAGVTDYSANNIYWDHLEQGHV